MRKRKSTTVRLVAVGYAMECFTGTCEGCRKWPRPLKYIELHWQEKEDTWITLVGLCGACTALCLVAMEDGHDPWALFGTRYPFVT